MIYSTDLQITFFCSNIFFHEIDWDLFQILPKTGLGWESEHNILTDVTKDKTKWYFARSMAANVNYYFRKKLMTQLSNHMESFLPLLDDKNSFLL